MIYNNFLDPQSVSQYHEEYLKLINFYQNFKRPSAFVKYFNINYDNSIHDFDTHATHDTYSTSNVLFDVYDFTPTYMMNPIVNATSNVTDMAGQMFESSTTIVTYTITRPRINDIVMFYPPVHSKEIYRVTNFRMPINALYANENSIYFYEIDLDIAPFNDINILKTLNMFVYDLSDEVYLAKNDYVKKIEKLNRYKEIVDEILKFYDPIRDLYRVGTLIPIITNQILYNFKRIYTKKSHRLFESIYCPYGIHDHIPHDREIDITKINKTELQENNFTMFNLETKMFETYFYNFSVNENNNQPNKLDIEYLIYLSKKLFDEMVES